MIHDEMCSSGDVEADKILLENLLNLDCTTLGLYGKIYRMGTINIFKIICHFQKEK